MDAGGSSETSVHIYQTTRHHVQVTAIFRTNFILPVHHKCVLSKTHKYYSQQKTKTAPNLKHVRVKLSQMHSFSTSPSFCQGISAINLMWSQVQSNPQSHTINPGHQVNPMVKKEMSFNGITDTVCEARQPMSRHCYNLCTTHFPTSNMTDRIFNKDKM